MANFIFNIAKGRVAELAGRVDAGDPAASRLYVVLLASTGLEAQSVLEDADTLDAVVGGTTNEATNTGYSRKVLAAADIGPFAPDDTGNAYAVDIPDQTWTAVANDGTGGIGALLVCYAAVATPTDLQITPLSHHSFAVTPDGSDVTAQIATGGFYSAS
jgi:hypothetical protein